MNRACTAWITGLCSERYRTRGGLSVNRALLTIAILTALCLTTLAQPTWKREAAPTKAPLELFHSVMTANFPTTESLKKGDFMYEISHRFLPPIKEGYDAYFGIDGPAYIRTALSFGITDRVMVTLGRTNLLDNTDLRLKVKLWEFRNETAPAAVAVRAGIALNAEIPDELDRGTFAGDNWQYYGQLVYNTMLFDGRLGLGLVPSYLYNSSVFTRETQDTFTMGGYGQYYINGMWSLWAEYNAIVSGYQGVIAPGELGKSYNSVATGLDIETGGHFFHLFVTNNARLNPAQFLVGADRTARENNWRLAFGITRYL